MLGKRGASLRCLATSEVPVKEGALVSSSPAPHSPPRSARPLRIVELRGRVATELLGPKQVDSSQPTSARAGPDFPTLLRSRLVVPVQEFFLPDGYPASVTPDYLPYQLWTVPTHILGGLSRSLATSALLKAVGIDASPGTATAASAAIKWITKDGLGAAGRFIVGTGRLGQELDDDPRRLRMLAEAFSTLGLALEVATTLQPSHFLVLASTGNFIKALSRGLGKPAFRVVQNHFASVVGNVGGVSAKEEVWEVAADLVGYAVSITALHALQSAGPSWEPVVGLWAATQAAHVLLRYRALSVLQFETLNTKRAAMLARCHVAGRPLPGIAAANAQEPLLASASDYAPGLHLGCTAADAFGAFDAGARVPLGASETASALATREGGAAARLEEAATLFAAEQHVLVWRQGSSSRASNSGSGGSGSGGGSGRGGGDAGGSAWVVLKDGCGTRGVLRAVWQWAWLEHHQGAAGTASSSVSPVRHDSRGALADSPSADSARSSAGHASANGSRSQGQLPNPLEEDLPASSVGCEAQQAVGESLQALEAHFDAFAAEAQALGWDLSTLQIKTGVTRLQVSGL